MFRIIIGMVFVAAAVAAWDYAALGYADVYDEATDVYIWLPTGYTLTHPRPEEVKAEWKEGALEGLKADVRWINAFGGKNPAALEEAMTKNYGVENLIPANERDLTRQRLGAFCAGAAEGRAASYEFDDYMGIPRAAACYFVLAHGKLYIFAVVWPRGNALAAEAGPRIAESFRIGPRPTKQVNPPAGIEP